MTNRISPKELDALLKGSSQFALIDVREVGEYNSSHIPGASLIPRKQLDFDMAESVPFRGTQIVVCDDDGRRAELAADTLESMGYTNVSVLDGGTNRWVTQDYTTEWGVNVPSKDFGERVEIENHVPEIDAVELHERIDRGDKLVILDTRTPEEYQRFCIPGGRSVPGGELGLRITDITKDIDDDTTVIVNCAGRTRSIIGTRVLQRMGIKNVLGLKNGTSGWVLAGYQLETGADRVQLPEPSKEAIAAADVYADMLAEQDGVRYLDIASLQEMMKRRDQETIYLIDVRTKEEYEQGHIPGFRWIPGGQAVQRSDEGAVAHNSLIIFACDGKARATFTASWFRQMGHQEVYAVQGGTRAWESSGLSLEKGIKQSAPLGFAEARSRVNMISPDDLRADENSTVIFVDASQDFTKGHVTGSRWVPRGWLEFRVADVVPSKGVPIVITCANGMNSVLAGATLLDMGYTNVSVLDGGTDAWQKSGLPVEQGLSGVMAPPADVLPTGPDRNYADMMNYLRWEEELGHKYERKG